MTDRDILLAIDQGTTSTRAILFDRAGSILHVRRKELPQIYPQPGWVEHDPEEIWRATVEVCRGAIADLEGGAGRIAGIGITNQRETTIVWDRKTGAPIHNAIVWQDRRTAAFCDAADDAARAAVSRRTGLVFDPYFSGTKIRWILESTAGAREKAARGELVFGTVDSFLIWRLTGGKVHATDATNASRTMLFDIHAQAWSEDLRALLDVPADMLPEVRDCAAEYGVTEPDLFGVPLPIRGVAGDQQAALVGQACFEPGMIKSTYGTGCFMILNTGTTPVASHRRLLTTVGYRIGGETVYAIEGAIFVAGAAVQWVRDGLGLVSDAAETEALARSIPDTGGVYMVPAFVGLGAPHWDPHARGALLGLTRGAGVAHVVRAALESVCYQTRDLVEAMTADGATAPTELRVDGGMAANDWMVQYLADILDTAVARPTILETTAWGAAALAGMTAGLFGSTDDIAATWGRERDFVPAMAPEVRDAAIDGWADAVRRVLTTQGGAE